MSTKTKVIAFAALLATLAAPETSFAQQTMFFPSPFTWSESGLGSAPADARNFAMTPTRRHAPRTAVHSIGR
jgi:hypothetical protein